MDSPSRPSSAGPTRNRNLSTSSSADTLQLSPVQNRSSRASKTSFSPYARPKENNKDGGLFSAVRGLPGRALGYLFRSASTQSLQQDSQEEATVESTGTYRGRGLSPYASPAAGGRRLGRSKTSSNLSSQLSHSESASSLATITAPPRSNYSTLTLPAKQSTFLPRSRAGSPALSSTSLSARQRSPSPTRNGLAGSMSSFNFNEFGSTTSPATIFAPSTISRSPFPTRLTTLPRSQSGNSLYPYSTAYSRGGSPTLSLVEEPTNFKRSRAELSENGSPLPVSRGGWGRRTGGGSSNGNGYNFVPSLGNNNARGTSPLIQSFGIEKSNGMDGMERARKKQLVWDPEKGFIGREELELEKLKGKESTNKTEQERMLEVLENISRTPLGETKRGSSTKPNARVPPASVTGEFQSRVSTLSHSVSTPLSPYSRRLKAGNEPSPGRTGIGLSSVFRAREERRRAEENAAREEREVRERERIEDEEREFEREHQRQERRRQREYEMEQDRMEVEAPRRKTRSMVKSESSTNLSKVKSPTKSKSKSKGKGKAKKEESDDERSKTIEEDVPMESSRPSRSKASSRASPVPVIEEEPAPVPIPTTEVPPPFASTLLTVPAAGSSMRPSRSHSSRTHVASSRVFSAREEDLPPVDEGNLGKIKLPPMVFPAGGFSFGDAKPTAMEVEAKPIKPIVPTPPPIVAPTPVIPIIKSPKPLTPVSTPLALPAISASSTAAADFFSKPAPVTTVVAPEVPKSELPKSESAPKIPSFFGAAIANAATPPLPAPTPPFSFGGSAAPSVVVEETPKVDAPNPFTAFGGSITAPAPPKPIPSLFGSSSTSISAPVESNNIFGKIDSSKLSTTAFGSNSFLAPAPTTTPSPFTFGAPPTPLKAEAKPAPFTFGAPSSAPIGPVTPIFGATPTNGFGGFGSAVVPPPIEDENDGDSGMEDNSPPRPSGLKPTFSFGAPTATTSTFPPTNSFSGFGSTAPSPVVASPFTFGPPAPTPVATPSFAGFGQPAATNSFTFGSNPTTPIPSPGPTTSTFNFGAPAASTTSTPFSFGAPAPSTNIFGTAPVTNSPFSFGAPAMAATNSAPGFSTASPFGSAPSPFGQPAANAFAPAPTSFNFGAPTSAPGSANGAAFAFGADPAAVVPNGGNAMFNLGSGGEGTGTSSSGRKIASLRRRK